LHQLVKTEELVGRGELFAIVFAVEILHSEGIV
jgi:hypothetical protein